MSEKRRIGFLNNKPVVNGDKNLVTKNEIHVSNLKGSTQSNNQFGDCYYYKYNKQGGDTLLYSTMLLSIFDSGTASNFMYSPFIFRVNKEPGIYFVTKDVLSKESGFWSTTREAFCVGKKVFFDIKDDIDLDNMTNLSDVIVNTYPKLNDIKDVTRKYVKLSLQNTSIPEDIKIIDDLDSAEITEEQFLYEEL